MRTIHPDQPVLTIVVIRGASAKHKRQAGAALLEYAFIFMMFLTLVLGIGGFGHALFTYHQINHVAKEATRYASVRGYECDKNEAVPSCASTNSASNISGPTTLADVQQFAQNMTVSLDQTKLVVSACGVSDVATACTASSTSGPQVCTAKVGTLGPFADYPGCTVSVTISYPYNFIFPLIPSTTNVSAPCTSAGWCMTSTSEMIIVH